MSKHTKYTRELLGPIVKDSVSFSEVTRKLGKSMLSGSMVNYVAKKIRGLGIDTSHFLGKRANSGDRWKGSARLTWQQILIVSDRGRRTSGLQLRRALVEYGRPYQCETCGISEWNGRPLVLEVDHIDGNWLDNRPYNVRFLCSNCHRQTKNYGNNKGLTGLFKANPNPEKKKAARLKPVRKKPKPKKPRNKCLDCRKPITKKGTRCKSCVGKLRVNKIQWPDSATLKKMVAESSCLYVARKLGVSDTSVRKRLKNHPAP